MEKIYPCLFFQAGNKKGIESAGMRGLSIPFLFAFMWVAFLAGCGPSIDSQLVKSMEDTKLQAETQLAKFTALQEKYSNLANTIAVVPENLRKGSNGRVDAIGATVLEYKEKVGAMEATYREQAGQVQQTAEEYKAGKLDTEKARSRFEPLRLSIEQMETELKPFESEIETAQQEYKRVIIEQTGGGKPGQ